jgi:hypothetical protein
MKVLATAAAGMLCLGTAFAQDRFPEIEYTSGKSGFEKKIKGALLVDEKAVKFVTKDGTAVFELPIASVVAASQSVEKDEGSFGRKAMLGVFASKTEEFLQIETKTAESAEVVVFKTKKKQSPGIAAKINFYVEKSAAAPAEKP